MIWKLSDSCRKAETHSSYGASGNRKDTDHGAGGKRVRDRPGGVYDHPSYPPERSGAAVYSEKTVRRERIFGDGVYDERDHRVGV